MSPDFFPGCSHFSSHNASILTCVCTKWTSRTWSISVGMFHRLLLKAATHNQYIEPNMRSRPSICPSRFPQAYSATLFRWPNCQNTARCFGQSIAGWHTAPLWPLACENTRLRYRQRELHCVLMWRFGHLLLWHVCFIWSEFIIIYSYNDKLLVTSICNTVNLSLKALLFLSAVYDFKNNWKKYGS